MYCRIVFVSAPANWRRLRHSQAKVPQSSRRRRTQRRATGPLHDRPRDGMLFFLDIIDVRPQNWVLIRHDFNWDPSSKNARICQQSINLESYTSGLDDRGIKCFTGFTMKPIKASDNLHALFAHHDAEKNPTCWILGHRGNLCCCWECTQLAADHRKSILRGLARHGMALWGLLILIDCHTPVETKWWILPEH